MLMIVKELLGSEAAVRQVAGRLGDNSFVIRTDVKSYNASIGHVLLMERLAVFIKDRGCSQSGRAVHETHIGEGRLVL